MKFVLFLLCLLILFDYGEVGQCTASESDYMLLPQFDSLHGKHTLSVTLELKGIMPMHLSLCFNETMNFLRLHCLFVLKDWFNISMNSLPVFMNSLNSKIDVSCGKTAKLRLLIILLLMISGNVQPNPGPDSPMLSVPADMDTLFSSRGLHILHLNVRSLIHKMDEIRLLFASNKVGIISFSETWLDNSINDSEIEIENYVVIRKDRNRNGGGVCVYIRSDICYNVRTDLDHAHIEAVWLDILFPNSKPLLIGALYRPPDQSHFYVDLEEMCLNSVDFGKTEAILIGDFNTNTLKKDSSIFKSLRNFCHLCSLHQLISQFTRVSTSSQTILDLVLTSDKSKISNSGVIDYGLSDHSMIFCTRKTCKSVFKCHSSVRSRSLKNYNIETLLTSLGSLDWSNVFLSSSVDEAWSYFKLLFLSTVDKIAPLKTCRIKVRTEPWVNSDIIGAIKARNDSFRSFRKNRIPSSFCIFKKLRNEANRLIRKAKENYFKESIAENKNNPSKLWKSLKHLGQNNRLRTKTINKTLNIGDTVTSDKLKVANCFNRFFTTIADTLVNKLPTFTGVFGESHVKSFYQRMGVQVNAFSFAEVSEAEVLLKLKALNPSKATGLDNIPCRFLRDAAEVITPSITFIINLSITQGHFPREFKLAKVTPLYKKGSKLEPGNYRPVSILCSISKVIEKVIFDQIDSYLSSHNLLYEFQSGFRKSHSTDSCLLYLNDFIRQEVDSGKYCGMVMLDLQKAFDTVNHNILLYKLGALGFSSTSLKWVGSYLGSREQVTDVNGTLSSSLPLRCGVPQGSILGPLFFLVYVNDMKSACDCNLFLFADDSALLVSHKEKEQVEKILSNELQNVSTWLADNKLSLHLGKTESILFGSNAKLKKSPGFNIVVNNISVENKEEVTYLGCILDNKLSSESMALKTISKINQKVKFLARLYSFLDKSTLLILAGALIQCHFDYACTSWYTGITKALKNKLQTSQNKLIRLLLALHPRTHLLPAHFSSLKWLRVEERVKQIKLCLVHKIMQNAVPKYLQNYFTKVSDVHSYSTRGSSYNIVPSKFKSCMIKNSFLYSAALLWNGLPDSLKLVDTLSKFKSNLKNWLMTNGNSV